MKKWIIALALLISCSGILPVNAANWRFIDEDVNGGRWYIDESSVVKEYGKAKAWIGWKEENGYYWVEQLEINKDRTMAMLYYIVYNPRMEVVDSYAYQSWEYKTEPIPPNTVLEGIYNIIW